MSEMETSALLQHLRSPLDGWSGDAFCVSAELAGLAADEIVRLEAALAAAKAALKPFADEAVRFEGMSEIYRYKPDKHSRLSYAAFYRARDAYAGLGTSADRAEG